MKTSSRALGGVLLVALCGCGRSAERTAADRAAIEGLLADYATRLTAAYRAGDPQPLAEVATEREIARVRARIDELAQDGRGLRPELRRLVIENVDVYGAAAATASALETWDLRIVALGSEQTIVESTAQENRVLYSLARDRGRWWVLSRLLKSSTEAP